MITQEVTYYKDYTEKSYIESYNGVAVVIIRWNKKGKITYYFSDNKWQRLFYHKNGKLRRFISNGLYLANDNFIIPDHPILERRFDETGRMTYERDTRGVNYDNTLKKNLDI